MPTTKTAKKTPRKKAPAKKKPTPKHAKKSSALDAAARILGEAKKR